MAVKIERALGLLQKNYSIIPIGPKKIPACKWSKYMKERITEEELRKYSSSEGFGIVTGYNNVEAIDVDLKVLSTLTEQQNFWKEYYNFLKDNIEDFDKKVVIRKTKNNGYHLIYRCEEIEGNQKLAKLEGHKEAIIETRGIGGYIFIYENQVGDLDYTDLQEISILERGMIIEISKYYDFKQETINLDKEAKRVNYNTETTPWEDYNNKHTALDVVSDEFDVVANLSDKYIIKRLGASSAHSGYIYKNSNCMYLFSTGTHYPAETLLNAFACYTFRYHNGDFSAAAKEVYKEGYGDRVIKEVEDLKNTFRPEDLSFPIDIFPENYQRYIFECYQTLDASIDYMGCSLLWALSLIIGNTINVEVKKGWKENVNIWIALIGKAGVGKTPSIDKIIFPLLKQNTHEIKLYRKEYQKYEDFKAKEKSEQDKTASVDKPRQSQFIANDVTNEALVQMHEENKNAIAVFKDELAGWFKDMNKYRAGSDLEFWLSSWSGKSVTLNRKTSKNSFVEKPLIPVLGGIQPSILDSFYTDENKDNGFIDRILFSYPDLNVESYNEDEINPQLLEWYEGSLIKLYNHAKKHLLRFNADDEVEPHTAVFSKAARKEWIRIFNEITEMQNSETENEYMKSMLPKQKSYIPRFALLINYINSDDENNAFEISKESMLKAESLSNYFVAMAKKIKIQTFENKTAKEIIGLTKNKSKKDQAVEILKNNPDFSKVELAEMLDVSRKTVYNWLK